MTEQGIQKVVSSKIGDPRPELNDHSIWEKFLSRILIVVPGNTYQAFRGMRALGAKFEYHHGKLDFHFPKEFDDDFKILIKKKYITPYIKIIKIVHNQLCRELSTNESIYEIPY